MTDIILRTLRNKTKIMISVMILLLMPVVLLAQPAPMSQQDLALGGISIGDSTEKVVKTYGKPLNIKRHDQNNLEYSYKNIVFYFSKNNEVDYIKTLSSDDANLITTPRGIAVGNSVEDLVKAYGNAHQKDSLGNNIVGYIYGLRYSSFSLLFECDSSTNKIVRISLYDAV